MEINSTISIYKTSQKARLLARCHTFWLALYFEGQKCNLIVLFHLMIFISLQKIMGLRKCYICDTSSYITFKFPTNNAKRAKWIDYLECPPPVKWGSKGPDVCHRHFEAGHFLFTSKMGNMSILDFKWRQKRHISLAVILAEQCQDDPYVNTNF